MNLRITLRFVCTVALVVLYQSSLTVQVKGQSANALICEWLLTTVTDRTGRDIRFRKDNTGVIVGTYMTGDNQAKDIRNIRVSKGIFYFEVPDLQLYFQMKQTRDGFQGTISAYSKTQKRVPEPAKLTRKTSTCR